MKALTTNAELYQYLRSLSEALEERGAEALSETIARASRASNATSEFLGESRIALKKLISEGKRVLTDQEVNDAKEVVNQIDGAFEFRRYRR